MIDQTPFPTYFVERVGSALGWPKDEEFDPYFQTRMLTAREGRGKLVAWENAYGGGWAEIHLPSVVVYVAKIDGEIDAKAVAWRDDNGLTAKDADVLNRINEICEGAFRQAIERADRILFDALWPTDREHETTPAPASESPSSSPVSPSPR